MNPRAITDRWRERTRRPWRWRLMMIIAALGLAAGLLGFLAHYWRAGSTYALGLSALSPYLLLGALGAVVVFAFARGRSGWAGLVVSALLVVWGVLVQAPLWVAASVPPGRDVVVLTANLRVGRADAGAVVRAVREHHVEVLMLEELTAREVANLHAAGLDRLLPYSLSDPHAGGAGTGLWSRYRLTRPAVRTDFGFSMVLARVAIPGQSPAPTMVAVHLYGPSPRSQFPGWAHDVRHLPSVLQALPRDAPVLAAGDYNATTDVAQFRHLLRGGYADGTDQAGAGYLPSYPTNHRFVPPVIAIDHVLTRGAVARRASTLGIPGSDHRALLMTVRLPHRH